MIILFQVNNTCIYVVFFRISEWVDVTVLPNKFQTLSFLKVDDLVHKKINLENWCSYEIVILHVDLVFKNEFHFDYVVLCYHGT